MVGNFKVTIKSEDDGEVKEFETNAVIFAVNDASNVSGGAFYNEARVIDVAFVIHCLQEKIQEIFDGSPEIELALNMIKEYERKEKEEN